MARIATSCTRNRAATNACVFIRRRRHCDLGHQANDRSAGTRARHTLFLEAWAGPQHLQLGTATTLREVHTATVNDWGAICWHDGEFHEATPFPKLEILDRVGGGDSFASGLIYGFLTSNDAAQAVNYGAAHGALAMTTPGDTTMATVAEVEKVIGGGGARVVR